MGERSTPAKKAGPKKAASRASGALAVNRASGADAYSEPAFPRVARPARLRRHALPATASAPPPRPHRHRIRTATASAPPPHPHRHRVRTATASAPPPHSESRDSRFVRIHAIHTAVGSGAAVAGSAVADLLVVAELVVELGFEVFEFGFQAGDLRFEGGELLALVEFRRVFLDFEDVAFDAQ